MNSGVFRSASHYPYHAHALRAAGFRQVGAGSASRARIPPKTAKTMPDTGATATTRDRSTCQRPPSGGGGAVPEIRLP